MPLLNALCARAKDYARLHLAILTALSLVNDAMATPEKRALADLVIVPDVKRFNPLNFAVARPLIDAGYAAAKAALSAASLPPALDPPLEEPHAVGA